MNRPRTALLREGIFLLVATLVLPFPAPASALVPIDPDGLLAVVTYLSARERRGRELGTRELDEVAAVVASRFEAVGLQPGGSENGSWYQEWYDPELKMLMRNVVGVLPGRNPLYAGQSVVIGAHYDGQGMGMFGAEKRNQGTVHPGADDNASGVAVLLELASRLPLAPNMERSIVFVAFTAEEAGRKGSRHFVRNEHRYPASRMTGMINIDTVGRLGKGKVVLLGAGSAKEWASIFEEAGKRMQVSTVPSGQDLDSSDHVSFLESGVPAVQLFTGAHIDYHRPSDRADKIDGKGLAKIAMMVRDAVFYLANHPTPLTATLHAPRRPAPSKRGQRKTTIGIVPDFTYNRKGVRLGGTVPRGPAEQAGMREGDIVIRVGQTPVEVLRDLSEIIRSARPGERMTVNFLRNGKEYRTTVEVRER